MLNNKLKRVWNTFQIQIVYLKLKTIKFSKLQNKIEAMKWDIWVRIMINEKERLLEIAVRISL